MIKRLSLSFLFLFGANFFLQTVFEHSITNIIPINNIVYAEDESEDEFDEDQACEERLKGTVSAETCIEACTKSGYTCGLVVSYDAVNDDELEEDLDCYTCRKYQCADFGRIDAAGKAACDADPDKKSIGAVPLPDGTPCWTCVDKKDTCSDKWAGSTVQATCTAGCPRGTHNCVKIGRHDGNDCYQCTAIVPPPPPPPLCKDWGLLIGAQCGTCKDPTPVCVPAGVAASNGACFFCAPKPKIQCSDYGLQDKCNCAQGEIKKTTWVTKVGPNGIKVRQSCCECVKKPKQCSDINLMKRSDCKKACKKPGVCKKVGRSEKGECFQCVHPTTCEERDYSTSCEQCLPHEMCLDVTTIDGVACKQCVPCPEQGLRGDCPGTCSDGQLCIKRAGPCHMCMTVKRVKVTWVIIIIETPLGRFVLDEGGGEDFTPSSLMAIATVDEQDRILNDRGEPTKIEDFIEGFTSAHFGPDGLATTQTLSLEDLSGKLSESLSKTTKYSESCFDVFVDLDDKERKERARIENPKSTPEELAKNDKIGEPAVTGPVISCGSSGKDKAISIYDASGALVDIITQKELKENPEIMTQALYMANERSEKFMQIKKSDINAAVKKFNNLPASHFENTYALPAPEVKKKKRKTEGKPVTPNDPFYFHPEKKKKKLLGIIGSSKKTTVNLGGLVGGMKMGMSAGTEKASSEEELKDQWGLHEIGFTQMSDPDSAWNIVDATEKNTLVAVIDSGFDMTHPDSPQYIWKNPDEIADNNLDDDDNDIVDDVHGWNFLDENHDFTDVRGHGTFVSGIIAAKSNNKIGIAGINPGAVIMPIKVVMDDGETNSLQIFRAINYAVSKGARVINISLGARRISALERVAINRAHQMGVFVAVASGNNGENLLKHGPASARHAFAVGQTDYQGRRSTVSNWGPNLSLLAPGEQIFSLCSKDNKHVKPSIREKIGYYSENGTSFSTPMVAATAALLLKKNPSLTPTEIRDILVRTSKDMDDVGWDALTGTGLLDAQEALKSVSEGLTVQFTDVRLNLDTKKKKYETIDIFATVRGDFKEYVLEVGQGKNPRSFEQLVGPFKEPVDYSWFTRVDIKESLRGSKDWVLRLKVTDNDGNVHYASTPVEVRKGR